MSLIASVELSGPFEINCESYRIKRENRRAALTGEQITEVAATASSSDPASRVSNIVDNSGLAYWDADGLLEHGTDLVNMWMSEKGQKTGWVEFDLGDEHKLGFIQVWNFNERHHTNRGVKKADISVWTESTGWKKILENFELSEAEGSDDYDEPGVVKLDGVKARKVRFDNLVNFGDSERVGLSEVQFFEVRGRRAVRPRPVDAGDIGTLRNTKIEWMPGLGALAHDVYIGADPNKLQLLGSVKDAGINSVRLSQLSSNSTYFWRIDELQPDGSVAAGSVWRFTTGRPIGWWKFDETTGTTATDSSGMGCHGRIVGAEPNWAVDGKFGGCLNFDETYGVAIPVGMLSNVNEALTISVWVNGDADQEDRTNVIFQAGDGDKPHIVSVYTAWQDNGSLQFATGPDETDKLAFNAARAEWAGTWNHYVFVKDAHAGFQKIYLNGKLAVEKTGTRASMAGIGTARIGIATDRSGDQYIGKLDDVRVYSYAMNDQEVAAIYDARELAPPDEPQIPKMIVERGKVSGNWIPVLVIFLVAASGVAVIGLRKKRLT